MCLQIRPMIVTSFFLVARYSFGNDKNKKEEKLHCVLLFNENEKNYSYYFQQTTNTLINWVDENVGSK